MSGKRSLFDVIEDGREIENDLNKTSMERISEGVDRLIEMTNDAFEHIQSLEDAIEQTDALASKTKDELEFRTYEDRARYGALVGEITKMSDRLSIIYEHMILLFEQSGQVDIAESLRDHRKKQIEEEEEGSF